MKLLSNIYLYSWVIYLLQGLFFGDDSRVGTLLLLFILSLSAFVAIRVIVSYRLSIFFRGLNVLLMMFTVYGIIYLIGGKSVSPEQPVYIYLKNVYVSFLPIYCFFYFSKRGVLSYNNIRAFFFLLLIAYTGSYIIYERRRLLMFATMGVTEITNNVSYSFVAMIPMLLLFKNKMIVQLLSLLYIMFFVIASFKRGAILISAICLVLLFVQIYRKANMKLKIRLFFVVAAFMIVGAYFVYDLYNTSERFVYQIEKTEDGNSSKRDDIYGTMIDYYFDKATINERLVGGGADYTFAVYGNYAHNDWLEILINNGILGVLVYILFFYCFFINIRLYKKENPLIYDILLMTFVILFIRTLFSMSYASISLATSLMLGYCFAQTTQMQEKAYFVTKGLKR